MARTNKTGPKTDPYAMISKQAEGALAENSFVKQGTTQDEVQPIATSGNEKAIGFVDVAVADNVMASVLISGNIVDCIAEGTIAADDILITGNGVGKVKVSAGTEDPRNQVGRALHDATEGQRIEVALNFIVERT